MYRDSERLHVEPATFHQQLPLVTWRYDLTPYGLERFQANARHSAEDWRVGTLRAALIVGSVLFLALVILAFLADRELVLWHNIHWPLGLWLIGVATAYVHAWLGYCVENPYPFTYRIRLYPDPLDPGPPPALVLVLEFEGPSTPPTEHAAPLLLGELDKLTGFEIRPPQRGDRNERAVLLAHFASDPAMPRSTKLVATWADGELEVAKPQPPLQQLHDQLSWALITQRREWLSRYHQRQLATVA